MSLSSSARSSAASRDPILRQAIIDQSEVGRTSAPVSSDSEVAATFNVRDPQAPTTPVYFEADHVNSNPFHPSGYSGSLPSRFGCTS